MQLNRALVFLCLVIAVGAQREHRVTCYLDALTPRAREGPCTHIIVPSAWINDSLNLQSLSEDDFDALGKMKGRNPTLKILLGLEVEASRNLKLKLQKHIRNLRNDCDKFIRLELMFTSESSVENFTHTSLSYLKEKRFDGLDLTWVNGPSSESSKSTELLRNFLKSLREAFEEETRSSDRTLLLSLSLSHQYDHSSAVGYDVRTLLQYVDFISLLPAHLEKDGPYINKTVQHWQDQQVDLQKLNLAFPAFLRRSSRRHHHHHHHHHPSNNDKNTEEGKKYHIHGVGLNLANRVCLAIKSREEFITLTSLSDEPSLVKEVSWLLQKGFGGVGVVFIDMDGFFKTECDSITQDERAIVESKMIMHHGRRDHGLGGHHHHHGREHHHSHRDHQSNLSHRSHDISHHHRHRHHHRHGHHGHHHHHPHPTPQSPSNSHRETAGFRVTSKLHISF